MRRLTMKFQVDGEEYLALLALKSTVEVVLKVWDSGKEFATPDSIDVFFDYLRKEAAKILTTKDGEAQEEFI
jgi:hypothetical protein